MNTWKASLHTTIDFAVAVLVALVAKSVFPEIDATIVLIGGVAWSVLFGINAIGISLEDPP